ncbi:hypothetical protein HDU87_003164 [Geranomyces variabilis]|uniref:Uncharacterized protein n=1 Tax=Geranomyces variabilis TaxID=109894 RepID=A0AAD5TB05_9FUNG|nr:hypothetical protein HDU87_003164 [Geranomyces variabilis]
MSESRSLLFLQDVRKSEPEFDSPPPSSAATEAAESLLESFDAGFENYFDKAAKLWGQYCEKVAQLTLSRNQLVAQRGRHLLVLREWFTAEIALAGIPTGKESLSSIGERYLTKPVIVNRSTIDQLKATPISADPTAIAAMPAFVLRTLLHKLWPPFASDLALPDQMVSSIAFALAADTAAAADTSAVEHDTKFVGFRVLADIVFTFGGGCRFAMELAHYVSNSMHANIRKGVARSDFAITAPAGGRFAKAGAAVFIAEFARAADSYPVHKDIFVGTAEAVYESHRLATHLTAETVHLARIHLMFGSERRLQFALLHPVYRPGGVFWVLENTGPTFDLSRNLAFGSRLAAALRMAQYMRDVVFPDGRRVQESLLPQPNPDMALLLPTLPTLIPEQRQPGPLTPFAKRLSVSV